MREWKWMACAMAGLLVAGCSGGGSGAANNAAGAAEETVTNAPSEESENAAVAANTTAPSDALAAFVGKYPFDKVDGASFLDQPAVTAAVTRAVPDEATRKWILSPDSGPAGPVFRKGEAIGSWACEQHNCGDHQWTILMAPTGTAQVCYHDAETMQEQSRWYDGNGGAAMKPGACPSDQDSE